ncbi:hypothetical protein [Actinoplanes sp. NPDC048796]|uniref:hypothetical protein n=1 Tax=Actinoplanes sp. NPDC048796 TaxID=3155640 RepID=UPI0033FAFE78
MMLFWQSVLIDERADRRGLRWPPAWVAGRDYLHRCGPVRLRASRGRDYLSSDVVYADLANMLSVAPRNRESPLKGRPAQVVKRLHPLDADNRTFALTVAFRLHADPWLAFSPTNEPPWVMQAYGRWAAGLKITLNPTGQTHHLHELGAAVGTHVGQATRGTAKPRPGERISPAGNAMFLSARIDWFGFGERTPEVVLDKPPEVRGRPFIALTEARGTAAARRRLRTYVLRTLAEVDIANHLAGRLAAQPADSPAWMESRARGALDFLSRPAPYGFPADRQRRIWQMSISRHGVKAGAMRRLAVERLSSLLASSAPERSGAKFVFMSDNYTFNGPVGAAGRHAQGVVNVNGTTVDHSALVRELTTLSDLLRRRDVDDADAAVVADAAQDLQEGRTGSAEGKLRRLSRHTLSVAKELALGVAVAAITHSTGLG